MTIIFTSKNEETLTISIAALLWPEGPSSSADSDPPEDPQADMPDLARATGTVADIALRIRSAGSKAEGGWLRSSLERDSCLD